MLELKHLRCIQAIATSSSLKSAAEKLFITDSALSHQLKDLEQRIGESLVIRKQQPPRLTASGQTLLQLAQQVLPLIKHTEQQLNSPQQRLNLALDCHACFQWLVPSLRQFQQQWPSVNSHFCHDRDYQGLPLLLAGEADLLLSSEFIPQAQLCYQALFEYEMVLIASPQQPFSPNQPIVAADLQQHTLISYPVVKQRLDVYNYLLKPQALKPAQWKYADNPATLVQMVAANMGVAAMPYWAVENYLQQQLIQQHSFEPAIWRPMYAVYRNDADNPQLLERFVQLIKQYALSHLAGCRKLPKEP